MKQILTLSNINRYETLIKSAILLTALSLFAVSFKDHSSRNTHLRYEHSIRK